jgi:hypothetical protein
MYLSPMNADERRCSDSLTEQVLSAVFEVSNTLGAGFLEKVYEREHFANEHTAQCLNYPRASGLTVCLPIDFQKPKVEWKRIANGFQDQRSSGLIGG